ncbi:MAG: FAD-binding protein [Desulfobacterales bacterium]
MYEKITGENPYKTPMIMIYPAVHYTMGGLWVDYNLMSTVDGLFVLSGNILGSRCQPAWGPTP